MKLNPEELEVMSFDAGAALAPGSLVAGAEQAPALAAIDPTPNSRCFVCDYT